MVRAHRTSSIPAFALYGEAGPLPADPLHLEAIQSRSRLYRWEIDAHIHHGLHQILWVAGGPARIALDGARDDCEGPVAIVVPPGVVHEFRFTQQTDGLVLTFHPRAVIEGDLPATGEALHHLFAAPRVLRFEPEAVVTRRMASLMNDLADEFSAPDAAGSPVPQWLARAVVWRLAQHADRQADEAHDGRRQSQALFTRFVVLVEAHHREHWPVSRYAARLGLTPERLNRLTRAQTGQGALDLVHERLAREACRRLTYIAAPVSKLAFELGFTDPAYFCRFFKRRTGQSPREFRRAVG